MAGDAGDAGGRAKAAKLARALKELHERAGSPTYAKLVRQGAEQHPPVVLKASVFSDWFNGRGVPADPGRFAFLVTWLEHEAARLDHAYVATPTAAWERLRSEAVRERRPTGRPHTPHSGEPSSADTGFVGRPVREFTDPFALEVHHAIDAPEHARAEMPVLPVYVARTHDLVLREAVECAAAGESAMVTLVAGSSTGKTRACWEALQGVPDGWRLWHPLHPGQAEAGLAGVGPRTVVCLNEAQTYLEPAGAGQRIATGLRELLHDLRRGPVLILATLWPDPFWTTLTTRPPAGAPDPHAQARALLTGTDLRVPEVFAGDDLDAVRARAGEDLRLAKALTSGGNGRITQFLAGALALLKRFELAPTHARAVLEAAMDARRLGHGPVLRQAFLEDAADAYLTDHESDALDDDWFEQALAYATTRVQGAVAPLTRIRPRRRTRDTTGNDGLTYRLADYLEQHARRTRSAGCPGTSFWDAAHDHAHTPADSLNLAGAARERLRLRHAERLFGRAIVAGKPGALLGLAKLRETAGDRDAAERLAREAVETGHPHALTWLAATRESAGDRDDAERLYRQAADTGDTHALRQLARMRREAGDHDGAERLYRQAADAGDSFALEWLARMRDDVGDHDGAEQLYRQAADAGRMYALAWLAELRKDAGDHDGAEHLAREAADAGNCFALEWLADLRRAAGDHHGAERLYRQAADAGSLIALGYLADLRQEVGDHKGAASLYRQAIDAGDTEALLRLAELQEDAGDHDGAEHLACEAADAGDTHALKRLAELREETGNRNSAERLRALLRCGLDAEDDMSPVDG
ncbi:hypothetical protein ACIRL2_46010 [Embleya sp. NPDC127516]|uniref:tetratricopeptide repeat protein n=1 Tax=Embleya sp. NPDC127516 TaxID=3363990 RepID=UPI003824C2C7